MAPQKISARLRFTETKTQMMNRVVVTGIGRCVGNVFGYMAKQVVVINGLEPVRKEIERCVAMVAKERYGEWVGDAVAYKASVMLQMPAVSLLGDLVRLCVSELIFSTITVTATVTGLIPHEAEWISKPVRMAIRVACVTCGYFVKCVVMQCSFPFVKTALEKTFKVALPLIFKQVLSRPFLPQMAVSMAISLTPPVTFICADIIAFLVEESLFWLTKRAVQKHAMAKKVKQLKII